MTSEERDEVKQVVQEVLQEEGVAIDDNTVFPLKNSAGQDDALLMMQLDHQHQATEYSRIEAEKVGGGGEPITIDPQPTKDSPNAVSSGGTYNELLNANARIDALNIQVGALLTKNMLDVRNNWSGAVGGEVEYSEDIPDTITAFDQLYSPVIRIGYGVPMCYSFYSDEEIGDSVIAFYGTDEPENARDYSDMSRPHTVLRFTRLDNDTYNDNTQKYRYFVVIASPFDGYLVLEHSKNNDNYTVICPMLEAGRTPTEYSADMTAYINAHLTSTQKTLAQRNIGLEKDVAGGVAGLDESGKIAEQQIPTDVVDGANLGSTSVQFGAAQQLTPTQQVYAQNNMIGKAYAPAQFSGLGKKVLSKNMQPVGGVQKNVMTQAFFQDGQGNDLENTVFVIQYDYTLGENITVPAGCILKFEGGSLHGGLIDLNGSVIDAPFKPVLYNVTFYNLGNNLINFIWFKYDNDTVPNSVVMQLINKIVDFNGLTLTFENNTAIYGDVCWRNLTLYVPDIKFYTDTVIGTFPCYKDAQGIHLEGVTTDELVGTIAGITTGKQVALDSRWRDGSPTLFKGVTSEIVTSDNNIITIADQLEDFTKDISNVDPSDISISSVNTSMCNINKAHRVELTNCNFILTRVGQNARCGSIHIGQALDMILRDCAVTSFENIGSDSLVQIGGCVGGIIENCVVSNAYYQRSQMSYGIQLSECTRIEINNCQFKSNRRSVDFSGTHETRYCIVSGCVVYGNCPEGSLLGGHSTSFKNTIKHNYLIGTSQVGIQLRGEQEIVDGNVLLSRYVGSFFTSGYKSSIINNTALMDDNNWGNTSIACFVYNVNSYIDDNYLIFRGNNLKIREKIFSGDNTNLELFCDYNTFDFAKNSSASQLELCESSLFKGSFIGNSIKHNNKPVDFRNAGKYAVGVTKNKIKFYKYVGGIAPLGAEESANITVNKAIAVVDSTLQNSEYKEVTMYLDFSVSEQLSVSIGLAIDSASHDFDGIFYDSFGQHISNDYVKQGVVIINGEEKSSSIICSSDKNLFYIGYGEYSGKLPAGSYKMVLKF